RGWSVVSRIKCQVSRPNARQVRVKRISYLVKRISQTKMRKCKYEIRITRYEIRTPRFLELSVQDSGVGIPRAEIGGLFEKYRQTSSGKTSEQKGTGLG